MKINGDGKFTWLVLILFPPLVQSFLPYLSWVTRSVVDLQQCHGSNQIIMLNRGLKLEES